MASCYFDSIVNRKGEEVCVGNWYSGTETSDTQVGEWPRVEVEYSGTETGDAQVGGWTYVVDMAGIRKFVRAS